jgi:actin-related protein
MCLARDAVDCGAGRSCPTGTLCVRGGAECLTRQEIADRVAAEQRKKEEEAARRKQEAQERKDAERRRIEEQREAARLKEEQHRQEIHQRKEEAERQLAEQKRQAEEARQAAEQKRRGEAEAKHQADIEAKQRAEEAKRVAAEAEANRKADAALDRKLRAIMDDRNQTPAARSIAAIALGKEPSSIGFGNASTGAGRTNTPVESTPAERELAKLALGKGRAATTNLPASPDEQLRAIMNDEKETPAARQLAAIALGKNAANIGPTPAQSVSPATAPVQTVSQPPVQGPSATYTFLPTNYGTVQVSQNGKIIATTTPQLAALQYGYKVPNPYASSAGAPSTTLSPATSTVMGSSISPVASSGSVVAQPKQSSNLWSNLQTAANPSGQSTSPKPASSQTVQSSPTIPTNASTSSAGAGQILAAAAKSTVNAGSLLSQFYQSDPRGQLLLNTLAGAGGAAPGKLITGLGGAAEVASLVYLLQQKDYAGIVPNLTSFGLSTAAASAAANYTVYGMSAGPLGGFVAVGSFELGKTYVAPIVAPTVGTWLYNLDPSFFIPAQTSQPFNPQTSWAPLPSQSTQGDPFVQQPFAR